VQAGRIVEGRKLPGSPDYFKIAGAAGLGGRLRRLSERIDREAGRIYKEMGVVFEQRWLGVLDLLSLHGALTVGELADALGVSHVAVSQVRGALAARGLIDFKPHSTDGRKRALYLTPQGKALVARLRPLWTMLDEVAVELNLEAGNVLQALDRLERALDHESLTDRTARRIAPRIS
jgi:MarR family transcriptional regulator, organic hydroperoxide resistance regulator